MGIVGIHPAVFRKSAEALEWKRVVKHSWSKERKERSKSEGRDAEGPLPRFFVSVASKGVSFSVSLLFATLAGRSISVADKGVTLRSLRRARAGFSSW
jgi:hypothetical protein